MISSMVTNVEGNADGSLKNDVFQTHVTYDPCFSCVCFTLTKESQTHNEINSEKKHYKITITLITIYTAIITIMIN